MKQVSKEGSRNRDEKFGCGWDSMTITVRWGGGLCGVGVFWVYGLG